MFYHLFLENGVFCDCGKKEIKCKGIQGFDILEDNLATMRDTCTATNLRISNSHLYALPNALINGTNIEEVKIESSYLPFLAVPIGDENPFIGGCSLRKFSVETVINLMM